MPRDHVVTLDGFSFEADGREIWSLSEAGQLKTCISGARVRGGRWL